MSVGDPLHDILVASVFAVAMLFGFGVGAIVGYMLACLDGRRGV